MLTLRLCGGSALQTHLMHFLTSYNSVALFVSSDGVHHLAEISHALTHKGRQTDHMYCASLNCLINFA